LRSLHPQATLARGYAIVEKSGVAVRSVRDVKSGDALDVRVSDGSFPVHVESKPVSRHRRQRAVEERQRSLFEG
jgi:exonuclease VII large subunit